jgi:hypothetical protein
MVVLAATNPMIRYAAETDIDGWVIVGLSHTFERICEFASFCSPHYPAPRRPYFCC